MPRDIAKFSRQPDPDNRSRRDAIVGTDACKTRARDDEQERTSRILLRDEWSSLQELVDLPLPVWTKLSSQRDDF